jgi:hypothetical protein
MSSSVADRQSALASEATSAISEPTVTIILAGLILSDPYEDIQESRFDIA